MIVSSGKRLRFARARLIDKIDGVVDSTLTYFAVWDNIRFSGKIRKHRRYLSNPYHFVIRQVPVWYTLFLFRYEIGKKSFDDLKLLATPDHESSLLS